VTKVTISLVQSCTSVQPPTRKILACFDANANAAGELSRATSESKIREKRAFPFPETLKNNSTKVGRSDAHKRYKLASTGLNFH